MPLYTLPAADEYAPYYGKYIERVGADPLAALVAQAASTATLLAATPESKASHRYAEGKWSVREVVVHMSDAERVFAYRALRVGRGDETPLPGFDEDAFAALAAAQGLEVLRALAGNSRVAVREMKQILAACPEQSQAANLAAEASASERCLSEGDAPERLRAFFEKKATRTPVAGGPP